MMPLNIRETSMTVFETEHGGRTMLVHKVVYWSSEFREAVRCSEAR